MKNVIYTLFCIVIWMGCEKTGSVSPDARSAEFMSNGSAAVSSSSDGSGGSGQQAQAGVITAGEWNDLTHWNFWEDLISEGEYAKSPDYWNFFTHHRIALNLSNENGKPVIDAVIQLKKNGKPVFTSRTDNKGNAELWIGLFQKEQQVDFSDYSIDINDGSKLISAIKSYDKGIDSIVIKNTPPDEPKKVNIAFVVDATGSMGDELSYLKTELKDVIRRAKDALPEANLSLSSVFYRDEGDEYLTRLSNFSEDISKTIDFIKEQEAGGGGDFPEAVHTALDKAVHQLQWATSARTRILFLLLDAPPHYSQNVLQSIDKSILEANKKGIKIIPITASGINKKTEFLMRFFAISTNGTYVFITNDSGIGNDHLEPTVGDYEVEYLNDLMVRLIKKYAE